MSALPRPHVTGPARALNDALHDLHHRAGWPSLRTLARETAVSHTTVSKAFSRPALPTWGTLELLVEAMDGDTARFHELWLAASSPVYQQPAPPIAGRRAELAVVRAHLETGSGLLLVTGEAGIGKTTLVTAAARAADVFVPVGRCRVLATPVPLLPVSDILRQLLAVDDGDWFADALATCPDYVARSLSAVLPEIGTAPQSSDSADFARQRLMSAVSATLGALGGTKPLALLVEDLPWADSATLDLVALLADGRSGVPLVATWRTEDPDEAESHSACRARMSQDAAELSLDALTRDETATQVALLSGHAPDPADLDAIYRRSRGQPLFTELLAGPGPLRGTLPDPLAQVLAHRLDRVEGDAWLLARTLGVADRPLNAGDVARAAGLEGDLAPALRTLLRQRLVVGDHDTVALRHPLIAEAIRNQLVPGEGGGVHRRVAELLERLQDPPASEIAAHWCAAGDPDRELPWRVRAAKGADARFARREAYPEWLRVLDLWGHSSIPDDERGVGLAEVHTRTIEAAIGAGKPVVAVRRHVELAMLADLPEQGRAEILLRAGDLECAFGDVDLGLGYLDEAVAINERYPPTSRAGHVLEVRANIHGSLGRNALVREGVERGMEVAAAIDDTSLHRRILILSAWQCLVDGDAGAARARAEEARSAIPAEDDPVGCLRVAAVEADILLMTAAPVDTLVRATADAVAQVDTWGFENIFADSMFASLGRAHLRAGDVASAASTIESRCLGTHGDSMKRTQVSWCAVQVTHGDLQPALDHLEALSDVGNYAVGLVMLDRVRADAFLWAGRPQEAIECLDRALAFVSTNDLGRESSDLLALRARAVADQMDATDAPAAERRVARARIDAIRGGVDPDPFGPEGFGADRLAHRATWDAERARGRIGDSVEQWVLAASAWDSLARPHDAAYCRWRAAQCALRTGGGTVAARLLRRASRDARQHVPLSDAIVATAHAE